MNTLSLKSLMQPTFTKVAGVVAAVCLIGWLGTEASIEHERRESRDRSVREAHNMDVAMGHWRESLKALIKASGVCQLRGHFCSTDSSGSGWYWHRESIRGPDVVDIILPRLYENRPPRAQITVFMRDKTGDADSLLPEVRQTLDALIGHLQVTPAAAAACKAARTPTAITDGQLTLKCERRIPAYYQDRLVRDVEGSSWTIGVENLP